MVPGLEASLEAASLEAASLEAGAAEDASGALEASLGAELLLQAAIDRVSEKAARAAKNLFIVLGTPLNRAGIYPRCIGNRPASACLAGSLFSGVSKPDSFKSRVQIQEENGQFAQHFFPFSVPSGNMLWMCPLGVHN